MPHQNLEQAVELLKAGKIEEARQTLELAIRDDRHDISAWQLYADSWPKAKDKIRVWQACLRFNPMNPHAQQALAQLTPKKEITQPRADMLSTAPVEGGRTTTTRWLLWISIGLFVIVAALAGVGVKRMAPKDPVDYRHTEPVEYYLYVPESYTADKEWPLFVGIHGAGGTGLDCWNLWQTYAEKEGFILLCPTIPGDANGFRVDVGDNTVWSAIGEVKKEYRVKQRMFLSGFSAGAFYIQAFTYQYPQYVSGLSILSAGLYMEPSAFIELVPMVVVIGDSDHPNSVAHSEMFVNELKSYGFDIQYEVLPGVGHTVTRQGITLTLDLYRKTMGK